MFVVLNNVGKVAAVTSYLPAPCPGVCLTSFAGVFVANMIKLARTWQSRC